VHACGTSGQHLQALSVNIANGTQERAAHANRCSFAVLLNHARPSSAMWLLRSLTRWHHMMHACRDDVLTPRCNMTMQPSSVPMFPSAMQGICGIGTTGHAQAFREPLAPVQTSGMAWAPPLPPLNTKAAINDHEINAHASTMYASGDLPSPRAFSFSKAHFRIDWRALSGIDIDRVVRNSHHPTHSFDASVPTSLTPSTLHMDAIGSLPYQSCPHKVLTTESTAAHQILAPSSCGTCPT
jgi:hypothetical protein